MDPLEHLLLHGIDEIQSLRRRNEILSAKVEMIDLFALVFRSQPAYPSVGMSEDIVWKMQTNIDQIRRNRESKAGPSLSR